MSGTELELASDGVQVGGEVLAGEDVGGVQLGFGGLVQMQARLRHCVLVPLPAVLADTVVMGY